MKVQDTARPFESELRISLKPAIAMLVVLGMVFFFVGDSQSDMAYRSKLLQFMLLSYAVSAISWGLESWKPCLGRWSMVMGLIALVHLGSSWLAIPGYLILMVIPTGLAAALIGLPAATVATIGESVLLLLLPRSIATGATIVTALVAIWAMLGVMVAVYHPVHQVAQWAWEYSRAAQRLLEEARNRQAGLEQALEDVAHANRQLALANERTAALRLIAEEAEKAKAEFAARVSHEFRAPLNMIIGLVDLMVETPEIYAEELPPDLWGDLEIVHRNCEHLSSMINDVLDLSQAEAGQLALRRERADLVEIVDSALKVVRPLVEKKQLGLQVTIPDDLPEIYCDRTRIRQVILNLVTNAARFTEAGGITVRVTAQDQHIVIGVSDTGPGISPEDAEAIFEPFCQGLGELLRDSGGSGLGLSISRRFVELHGGRMWLASELGVGSTFFFQLPVSPPVERVARPGHWTREDWVWRERAFRRGRVYSTDQLVTPRVIICDETGDLYPEFVRYSDEIEFVDTRDLTQATRELRQCPAHAVVLNAAVPDSLLQLVETARRETPGTPIIGCSVPRAEEQALESGALGYLVKPVTRTDMEQAIRAVGKPVRRVLLVDDDPDVLRLWTRMLHVYDGTLDVVTASSGEQALDELRSRLPDLVLLDVLMPGMNGWQLLELIGQDESTKGVPVFFVSAQDPVDHPLVSKFFLATMGAGLSISKLLRCSLGFSALLLEPDRGLDRALV